MNRLGVILVFLMLARGLQGGGTGSIVLARNGVPAAGIVLGRKPTRSAQMAAFELQHVVKLVTGALLPIGSGRDAGLFPIHVGGSGKEEFRREQYLVSVSGDCIRLTGNDSPDFGKVDYQDEATFPGTGYHWRTPRFIYNYHSSLYAVYEFLERCCGVRFYGFGDLGIAFRKRDTLAVKAPLEIRREPRADAFRYAGFVYRGGRRHSARDRHLLQLRWRMNTIYGQTNHTTSSLLPRYWGRAAGAEHLFVEKRRDCFIRGYERTPIDRLRISRYAADDPPPAQLCTSNRQVIDYFAREAAAVYRGRSLSETDHLEEVRFRFLRQMPGFRFYYPVQEEDNSDWCRCEECMRLFPEVKGPERHAYLHFDFVNKVQRAVRRIEPDLNLCTLAYNMALAHPDPGILRLEPGYAVQICLGIHSWMHPLVYRRQHGMYKEWIRTEGHRRPLTVWIYMLSPESDAKASYRYDHCFPVRYPWKTVEICREFMQDGIRGIFLEVGARSNLLEGYLAMKTAFDPDFDADEVIGEYFLLCYGRAAEPMREFFRLNQEIVWDHGNYPEEEILPLIRRRLNNSSVFSGLHTQRINWSLGTPERMRQLQRLVDQAWAQAEDPQAKERLRIFMADVWTQARLGRQEYDLRLEAERNPPPGMSANYLPGPGSQEVGPEIWEAFRHTSPWLDLSTRKPVPGEDSPRMRAAATDEELILSYEEKPVSPDAGKASPDFWSDNVEIFFGKDASYPFHQLAVGRNGKWEGYRHEMKDETSVLRKWTPEGVRVRGVPSEGDAWKWRLHIPWKAVDLKGRRLIRINFIRNRPGGLAPLAWSYLPPGGYAAGIHRMGYLHLPEAARKGGFSVNPGFRDLDERGEPVLWMQNLPDRGQPAWSCEKGELTLDGRNGLVHYMTLISRPLRRGDRLVVAFVARGSGTGLIGQYLYSSFNAGDKWRWRTAQTRDFQVSREKRKYRIVLDTGELKPEYSDILAFRPFLGAREGARIVFSEVSFEFE